MTLICLQKKKTKTKKKSEQISRRFPTQFIVKFAGKKFNYTRSNTIKKKKRRPIYDKYNHKSISIQKTNGTFRYVVYLFFFFVFLFFILKNQQNKKNTQKRFNYNPFWQRQIGEGEKIFSRKCFPNLGSATCGIDESYFVFFLLFFCLPCKTKWVTKKRHTFVLPKFRM